MTLREELERVLALAEKATAGEWEVLSRSLDVWARARRVAASPWVESVRTEQDTSNAALIAAAVNFLRTHGQALLAAEQRAEGVEADARRYRFLRDEAWHPSEPWQERLLMEPNDKLDAAIDALQDRALGEGGG